MLRESSALASRLEHVIRRSNSYHTPEPVNFCIDSAVILRCGFA
jgi:hypothetical protein